MAGLCHPEIDRRGTIYSRELGDQFTSLLLHTREEITQPDPETAIASLFNAVFSSLVLRTMYGPGFATPADDDHTFVTTLSAITPYVAGWRYDAGYGYGGSFYFLAFWCLVGGLMLVTLRMPSRGGTPTAATVNALP